MPSFLEDRSPGLLFFGGKGGVGKTTGAAATAVPRARRVHQNSFLLVSTDPAPSLADNFADFQPPGNLCLPEFHAQECLEAFQARHRGIIKASLGRRR